MPWNRTKNDSQTEQARRTVQKNSHQFVSQADTGGPLKIVWRRFFFFFFWDLPKFILKSWKLTYKLIQIALNGPSAHEIDSTNFVVHTKASTINSQATFRDLFEIRKLDEHVVKRANFGSLRKANNFLIYNLTNFVIRWITPIPRGARGAKEIRRRSRSGREPEKMPAGTSDRLSELNEQFKTIIQ